MKLESTEIYRNFITLTSCQGSEDEAKSSYSTMNVADFARFGVSGGNFNSNFTKILCE